MRAGGPARTVDLPGPRRTVGSPIAAGGLFGTFPLVIFVTIAIRIERNLRDIAARAQTAALEQHGPPFALFFEQPRHAGASGPEPCAS